MCGIVVVIPSTQRISEATWLRFGLMLQRAQIRGEDATGAVVVSRQVHYVKAPYTASELVWTSAYLGLGRTATTLRPVHALVGHTREATIGTPLDNANNHPIIDSPLVGVHNGQLWNHVALAAQYGTTAQVDSAALVRTVKRAATSPLTLSTLNRALHQVVGMFALVLSDMRCPDAIWLAVNYAPLVYTRHDGVLYIASTIDILDAGLPTHMPVSWVPCNTVARVSAQNVFRPIQFSPLSQPSQPSLALVRKTGGDVWDG